jgi:radical S-adenosyl methionine domain-containing protein 2
MRPSDANAADLGQASSSLRKKLQRVTEGVFHEERQPELAKQGSQRTLRPWSRQQPARTEEIVRTPASARVRPMPVSPKTSHRKTIMSRQLLASLSHYSSLYLTASPSRIAQVADSHSSELVINWHLTEACNYSCRYCYAKWHADEKRPELIRDPVASEVLINAIFRQFAPTPANFDRLGMEWKAVRLSLAGGEPLLYDRDVVRITRQAAAIGFKVSIISNGSRLTEELMSELAPNLSVLGLSLDSIDPATNREIGRADKRDRTLQLDEIVEVLSLGRRLNPMLKLKINTVVNALNFAEDLTPLIRKLAPDKWKILRMLPAVTTDLAIANHEFAQFLNRDDALADLISAEDNSDMVESYIMIDPRGRFFQNSGNWAGYRYSDPILNVGVDSAFSQIDWRPEKFKARYTDHHPAPAL